MSWFASFLPSIPTLNLAIPTGIQARFVSFFLKKLVGRFVKPGQLDTPQIDSQIGSGYVQINDLELDPATINTYLAGLPASLESGTVKAVTARIPWPNPLTASIGFSLSSLHLKLLVHAPIPPDFNPDVDLASSVASVAESFVHEELSDPQEAKLWESYRDIVVAEDDEDHIIPGGLDHGSNNGIGSTGESNEVDPAGVSMFATLIERLLARFQFDAQDIQITLVDPDNVSWIIYLSEIRYSTIEGQEHTSGGVRRSVTLHGIKLATVANFPSQHASPSTTRPDTPSSAENGSPTQEDDGYSSHSSTSSLDENAQFLMSQSLAILPPRTDPLAESASSSVYHSMVSERPTINDSRFTPLGPTHIEPPSDEPSAAQEHLLLSLGSTPLEFSLTTPSPGVVQRAEGPRGDPYRFKVTCGSVAFALQPWQVASVLRLVDELSISKPPSPERKDSSSAPLIRVNADLHIRSLSIVILGQQCLTSPLPDSIQFFFHHPLTAPQLPFEHTKLVIEGVDAHSSISTSQITSSLTVKEVSAFRFTGKGGCPAIPILISDPHLTSQYDHLHTYPSRSDPFQTSAPQPNIPIINWFDNKCFNFGPRISQWRSRKSPHERPRRGNANLDKEDNEEKQHRSPVIAVQHDFRGTTTKRAKGPRGTNISVDVAPLHIILDLETLQSEGGLLWFVEEIGTAGLGSKASRSHQYLSDEEEDSDFDARTDITEVLSPTALRPETTRDKTPHSSLAWSLGLAALRVSVGVPPPPGKGRRSGILTVDLLKLLVADKPPSQSRQLRFASSESTNGPLHNTDQQLAHIQFQRALVGCSNGMEDSLVPVVSIGALQPSSEQGSISPQLSISPQVVDGQNQMSIRVDIPSIYCSLSKKQLEALHYFIDDLSQALERANAAKAATRQNSRRGSKDASMIGSRYFAGSRTESGINSQKVSEEGVKKHLLVNITELYCRIHLPRLSPEVKAVPRPFDVACSDFSVNVKAHSSGKIELLLSTMDAFIQDTDPSDSTRPFLSLTRPRSLIAVPVPLLKVKIISSPIPGSVSKENKLSVSLHGFTFNFYPDLDWVNDFVEFLKSPPGTFESVVPNERTLISLKVSEGSVKALAPAHSGAMVLAIGGLSFVTDIIGEFPETSFRVDVATLSVMVIEDASDTSPSSRRKGDGVADFWRGMGYALLAEVSGMKLKYQETKMSSPEKQVIIDGMCLKVHACADTFGAVGAFIGGLTSSFKPPETEAQKEAVATERIPATLCRAKEEGHILTESIDDAAFRKVPEVGPAPDMIYDDLPTNLDYLDESFGAAAGLRELTDDDLDEFDEPDLVAPNVTRPGADVVSMVGGETIKVLEQDGINYIEDYYDSLPREAIEERPNLSNEGIRVRILGCDVYMLLYDGYDWSRTRRIIEDEVKDMRKRLAKIRQLVASGQAQEPIPEDTNALLFNSVYIGLHEDVDAAEPEALLAAIDEELREDFETGTQSSWQSLKHPGTSQPKGPSIRVHGKKLTRSKGPSIEFCLMGVNAEFNQYGGDNLLASRTFVTVRDLEILDHIRTSTWKKFLTALRSDSKGNIRETGANMVRIELHNVRPALGNTSEEARLRVKLLPIRLYVDQDAVDFLKKFFSFKDPSTVPSPAPDAPSEGDAYIQLAEIFPVDLKLDYKPRRVDYRALREGKTIELMNFFHFDGAEMTLRHIKLTGVTGWPKMFEMLNDLWTPDVKATQLVEVISGVAPIRSVVNVGSGVADLVLLPISQYKKDGRIVRGVQKGATAFVKSTAIEAIKMGARLATGTQVILEQAEGFLGGESITAETIAIGADGEMETSQEEDVELTSKYAQQPADIKEGVQFAYKSLRRNLSSAAQTILAVPMEVYERSGNEGPVRSVIRAVPIAVLKPMIGASEAVSKTLLGLHNTLDPNVRLENEAKYK